MNARQKAKYYKRKYDELKNMPLPKITITNHKIDTLRFQKIYPELSIINEEYLKDMIKRDIINGIASELDRYVTTRTFYEERFNGYRFMGEIKVVRPERW